MSKLIRKLVAPVIAVGAITLFLFTALSHSAMTKDERFRIQTKIARYLVSPACKDEESQMRRGFLTLRAKQERRKEKISDLERKTHIVFIWYIGAPDMIFKSDNPLRYIVRMGFNLKHFTYSARVNFDNLTLWITSDELPLAEIRDNDRGARSYYLIDEKDEDNWVEPDYPDDMRKLMHSWFDLNIEQLRAFIEEELRYWNAQLKE